MRSVVAVLVLLACNAMHVAHAAIPAELNPLVIEAPFSFFVREFDLTPAFERARVENKPMFVYLDAWDCPPCNEYADFLGRNIGALKPHFAKVVVVDLRTSLRGSALAFRIRDRSYSFEEFKTLVGDQRIGLPLLLAPRAQRPADQAVAARQRQLHWTGQAHPDPEHPLNCSSVAGRISRLIFHAHPLPQ